MALIPFATPGLLRQSRQDDEESIEIKYADGGLGDCKEDPETDLCCMIKEMNYTTIQKVRSIFVVAVEGFLWIYFHLGTVHNYVTTVP